ncbi:nucleotidyltransferase domain-containing protein [Glutamicibacter sp. NPDC087344]|uniref:nucleotidyltransferase domain-containing protein n=1 Tax=Glutamicibacter sp. NPDC087344 TaxID=3363994 RepID=UPI0037F42D00
MARSEQYLTIPAIHRLLPEAGSLAGVRKALGRLVEQGIVLEQVTGRTHSYALNQDHLLAEVISKISETRGELTSRIQRAIDLWPIKPVTAKIFGSAARGDMRSDSDIDLFVVMPDETPDGVDDELAGNLAAQIARWTGNDVRPLLYRAGEVKPAAIIDFIIKDGIDVAGDPAWLRRTVREKSHSA